MSDDSYRPGEEVIEGMYESSKTISWEAFEEARQLRKPELLPMLFELINQPELQNDKSHLYFIIGFIGKNTDNPEAANFLLQQLKKEKSPIVCITILDRLAEIFKPHNLDLSYIKHLIEKKGYSIRSAAYRALINTEHQMEDYFIDKLQQEIRKDDIIALMRTMEYIGTKKSLSVLEPHLKNRKLTVKHIAQEVSATIMLREGFPITEICRKLKLPALAVQVVKKILPLRTLPG
jgi:hypothetical protein